MKEQKEQIEIIERALKDLSRAVNEMLTDTVPNTPLPRPRIFYFASKCWPKIKGKGRVDWYHLLYSPPEKIAREIVSECEMKPRCILRALRRIQAATSWCYKRAEGRRRLAEEILRQQEKFAKKLEREGAFGKLQEL